MDRDEGALKMQGGYAFSSGFFSPASWYHSGAYKTWPGYTRDTKAQDQAEGKRLLKEAGYVGAKVHILCRTDYLFMCEFTESVLRGVGFDPFIDLKDVNAQSEMSRTGQYQAQTSGPGAVLYPGDQLSGYVTYAANAGISKPLDTKIDDFQKIILTSTDPLVRRQALWDAENYYLVQMAYNAPFLREETVQAYRTYLKGSIVPGFQPHTNYDRATDWIDKALRDKK
jgi:ABC-type transport system substrate-binding protein